MSDPVSAADVYRPPQAPPLPVRRPWLRGILLATLPSLLYFAVAIWLEGWIDTAAWIVAVVLTFYGVGVFVWSTKEKPTWGRAVVAMLATGIWLQLMSYVVSFASLAISILLE